MARSSQRDYVAQRDAFESWFQTPLGRALLSDQRTQLEHVLGRMSGAHQLFVSISHRLPLATATDFSKCVTTTPHWSADLAEGVVVCDSDELPFPSESMELVVMHHTHDFAARPHQVVREAARVLRSFGRLVIIGFNPFSLWGVRKLMSRRQHPPWSGRFITQRRLEDWLSLLQFEIDDAGSHFFRPPMGQAGTLERMAGMERLGARLHLPAGAYYCICAEKRVPARTANRIRWPKPKPVVLPVAGVMGSTSAPRGAGNMRRHRSDDQEK